MQKIIKNIAKIAFVAAIMLPFNGAQAATPISCPLTAGNNSYIVNFPSAVIVSNTGTAFANELATNANLPAGSYTVTAVTWDAHSEHGDLNQHKEQLFFQFYNSSGSSIGTTGSTNDISASSDSATTALGDISIGSAITKIIAKHSYRGEGNYQSVWPICIKMSKIDNEPDPDPEPTDFSVSCSVSDRSVETDNDVTFTATVTGGDTPFTYRWSGDVSGSGRSITESFDDEGRYDVNVRVTDDAGRIRSADCGTVVVDDDNNNDDDDLEVSCEVSDSSIEEGDEIRISVDIDGGEGPFDIEWDGDIDDVDDFDDDAKSQRVEFEDSGRYEFEVTVEDDNGDEDSDTCTVRVSNDRDTLATSDGELAGLSSVYLSQVPYTGVEDTAKVFGFIALIAVWSGAIAYYLLKNKTRAVIKSKIQSFKEANLAKKQVRN